MNGNPSYVDLKHRRITALQKFLAISEMPSLEEDGYACYVTSSLLDDQYAVHRRYVAFYLSLFCVCSKDCASLFYGHYL